MKVLFLDAYFYPENTSFSHLEKDIMDVLIEQGHEIDVVCPVPTRGVSKEVHKEYKRKKYEELLDGKIRVHRCSLMRERRNPILRAIRYFLGNYREYRLAKKIKGVDVIFCDSTPPTQPLVAGKLAKRLKCRFIYSLQDIFPESLVTTGLSGKKSIFYKMGERIEKKSYAYSDKIIVISSSMKQNLLSKGVGEEKLELISNWVDTDTIKRVEKADNKLFDELDIDKNKFTVVYGGNFGVAQGTDVLLETAEILNDNDNIQFVFFGGGSDFETAKTKCQKLKNVKIFPLLSQDRVPEVYSLGDVACIVCKKDVGKSSFPSKTWAIMSCNTPIIASFDMDSELAKIVLESDSGVVVNPEDANALAQGVLQLYQEQESGKYLGGRAYVEKYASKKVCATEYVRLLTK